MDFQSAVGQLSKSASGVWLIVDRGSEGDCAARFLPSSRVTQTCSCRSSGF